MTTNLIKPSRIDFDKVDINQIQRILSTGTLEALAPDEREYYSLMEMVRGLRARMRINGKLVTKAGIIRLLKSEPYGLSDWMARQVYADSLNFFYTQDNVRPQAFANLYAEKAENWANTVFLMGNVKEAKNLLKLAAELRGCYKDQQTEIPEELLSQKSTVIYTTSRKDLGVPEIDRKELEEFIDAIPEIPVIVRDNIKEDARIKAFDLKKRMLYSYAAAPCSNCPSGFFANADTGRLSPSILEIGSIKSLTILTVSGRPVNSFGAGSASGLDQDAGTSTLCTASTPASIAL